MRIIDSKLYLTFREAIECGINAKTMIDAKTTGAKCWDFMDDPEDRRRVLVGYEGLTPERQGLVKERFGNPYDMVARQPILAMVVNDHKAVEYYKRHRYDGGLKFLTIETVNKYVRAAAWLGMLAALDKKMVKKELGLAIADFFIHVNYLVALEKGRGKMEQYHGLDVLPGDFPSTYQRLMARVSTYSATVRDRGAEAAYEGIIDKRYENKSAAKLGKQCANVQMNNVQMGEAQGVGREIASAKSLAMTAGVLPSAEEVRGVIYPESVAKSGELVPKSVNKGGAFDPALHEKQTAVIRYCAALHNNLNAAQVCKMANTFFSKNGWKTVSVATIRNFIRENKHVLTPGRKGKREYMSKVAMQNKRTAPKFPMVYWTLDGWAVELLYKAKGPKGMRYDNRLVVVVVLDAFNKYPIGYAIADRETPELIKNACRNAIMHTQELFGTAYQPLQLQSDNYQIKHLTPFYQAVKGRYFTPAAVGNSKAKVIEPYFNYLNDVCQSRYFNWSGHNVDASKENQPNVEMLDMIKSQFPEREGVVKQIEQVIALERESKYHTYMERWQALPAADKMALGVEDYLMLFGEALNGRTNRIEGQGIIKQIDRVEYTYDSFDPEFRRHLHIDWQIIGDKEDLRRVLAVSPDNKMRFMLEQKRELPMDIYSTTQEDVDYRVRVKDFNDERMAEITGQYADDAEVMAEVLNGSVGQLSTGDETALKLMLTKNGQQKERLQDAKGLKQLANVQMNNVQMKREADMAADWEAKRLAWLAQDADLGAYNSAL